MEFNSIEFSDEESILIKNNIIKYLYSNKKLSKRNKVINCINLFNYIYINGDKLNEEIFFNFRHKIFKKMEDLKSHDFSFISESIKNKLFDTFKKCESKLLRPDIEINRSSINEDKINEDKIEKIIKSHYGDNIEIEFVEDNDSENSDSDCSSECDYLIDEELQDKINNEFTDRKFTISTSRTLHSADNFN